MSQIQEMPQGFKDRFDRDFAHCLTPISNRTLVWRARPEVDYHEPTRVWRSYWRCIQLEDDAHSATIEWNF